MGVSPFGGHSPVPPLGGFRLSLCWVGAGILLCNHLMGSFEENVFGDEINQKSADVGVPFLGASWVIFRGNCTPMNGGESVPLLVSRWALVVGSESGESVPYTLLWMWLRPPTVTLIRPHRPPSGILLPSYGG